MRKTLLFSLILTLTGGMAVAERIPHAPIIIRSDRDFTAENGVVAGSGTLADPYLIAGWDIDEIGADHSILIEGTTRPFLISDVRVCGAKMAGIKILGAKHGRVDNCLVHGCTTGVMVFLSQKIEIRSTRIEECSDAVRAFFSSDLTFTALQVARCTVGIWFTGVTNSAFLDSAVSDCALGVKLELGSQENMIARNVFLRLRTPVSAGGGNLWDDGARGNYWDGFQAPDANNDGILDYPYAVGLDDDRFPLAAPPGGWE